jgi:hypothetical protein
MTRAELVERMKKGICCQHGTCCFHDQPEKCERDSFHADATAALAAIEADHVVVPRGHLEMADCWLTAALECKTWHWDADQHEAATETRDALRVSLAASPLAKERGA